jgi:hypothetical protein
MKQLAFLGITIATLVAPIQVQAQQYDPAANCVRFQQNAPNPEAEVRYLLSHPNVRVCPSGSSDPVGQAATVQHGMTQGAINTMGQIRAMRGY